MTYQSDSSKALLSVGKIVKAQGIKGEVKILPFSGVAEDLLSYKKFFMDAGLRREPFKVEKSRVHGKFFVLKLSTIDSRNASEELIGQEVYVGKEDMPALPDDEFYWNDFEGLRVVTDQGEILGVVTSLMSTGANDILVIGGKGKEYLVPAIDEIIVEVDWQTNTLVIAPLPGLLEINDPDAV